MKSGRWGTAKQCNFSRFCGEFRSHVLTVRATTLSPPNIAKKFRGKFPRDKYLTRTPRFTPIRGRTNRWVFTGNPNESGRVSQIANEEHLFPQNNFNLNQLSSVQGEEVKEDIPDNRFVDVVSAIVIETSLNESFGVSPEASSAEVITIKKKRNKRKRTGVRKLNNKRTNRK